MVDAEIAGQPVPPALAARFGAEGFWERWTAVVDEAAGIRASFDAVGATQPVELSHRQRIELLIVLEESMHDRESESIPPGMYELRNALWEELHDPVKQQAAE